MQLKTDSQESIQNDFTNLENNEVASEIPIIQPDTTSGVPDAQPLQLKLENTESISTSIPRESITSENTTETADPSSNPAVAGIPEELASPTIPSSTPIQLKTDSQESIQSDFTNPQNNNEVKAEIPIQPATTFGIPDTQPLQLKSENIESISTSISRESITSENTSETADPSSDSAVASIPKELASPKIPSSTPIQLKTDSQESIQSEFTNPENVDRKSRDETPEASSPKLPVQRREIAIDPNNSELVESQPIVGQNSQNAQNIDIQNLNALPDQTITQLFSETRQTRTPNTHTENFPQLPTVLGKISEHTTLGQNTNSIGNQIANNIVPLAQPIDIQAKFSEKFQAEFQEKYKSPPEPFSDLSSTLASPIQRSPDKRTQLAPVPKSSEASQDAISTNLSAVPSAIQRIFDSQAENASLSVMRSPTPDAWSSLADLVSATSPSTISKQSIPQQPISQPSIRRSEPIVQRQPDSDKSPAWSSISELIDDRKTTNVRSSLAAVRIPQGIAPQTQKQSLQRDIDPSNADTVEVSYKSKQENDEEVDISASLEILAQEIYGLLRQRIEIERERHGSQYYGQLPW
jgi:hypothetical protein